MTDDDKAQDRRLASVIVSGGRLRALTLELWQRTRLDWGFVTDRLSQTFRRETWLGASERRVVAETLYGMVRFVRRVDHSLAAGARRGASPRDADRLVAYFLLEGLLTAGQARAAEPAIDWERVIAADRAAASERAIVKRIAVSCSFPDWLAERLVADWGERAEPLARALNQRAPMTVRANRLKTTRDQLAQALAEQGLQTTPGRYAGDALQMLTRTNLFGLPELKKGWFEAQDEGSQLLAELVTAHPGPIPGPKIAQVVDLCAGAGGKTLALAAAMSNRGRVLACDVDGGKLDELRRRARRAGVTTVDTAVLPGGDWPDALEARRGQVARVLVDAPCTGTGALRRNPEARWRMLPADVDTFVRRQTEITTRAAALLAPGGRLIYATCSVLAAENQGVAEAVAAGRGLRVMPLREVLGERASELATDDGRFFSVAPDRHGTDGFFAAVLECPR